MSPTYVFTISPAGPAGMSGEDGPAPVRSDTLAGALRSVAAEGGGTPEFAGPDPPFRVSSVFPEVSGVRLYPRPLAEPAPLASLDPIEGELFRRIWRGFEFVTEARLESLAVGRRPRFDLEDIIEGRAWGMPSERGLGGLPRPAWRTGIAVDRAGGGIERFSRRRIGLAAGGRLFFIARLPDADLLAPLKELVARLGEAGLGARRSTGAGRFALAGAYPAPGFLADDGGPREQPPAERPAAGEAVGGFGLPGGEPATLPPDGLEESAAAGWEPEAAGEAIAEPEPEPAREAPGPRPRLLLSLYLPSREEVDRGALDGMAGRATVRGGWIVSAGATGFRKRPVRMLVEGTVLPASGGPVTGEVRDVRPEGFGRHPVWRDGRALAISYGGAP